MSGIVNGTPIPLNTLLELLLGSPTVSDTLPSGALVLVTVNGQPMFVPASLFNGGGTSSTPSFDFTDASDSGYVALI
jgi:hypothetical protein